MEVEFPFSHQDADQRVGDAFRHRPAQKGHVTVKCGRIALCDEMTVVDDQNGPCFLWFLRAFFCKSVSQGFL